MKNKEGVDVSELLDLIHGPNDIKEIEPKKQKELAKEIRKFLIEKVSKTGGHLASNLGTVELTIALHLVLDFPKDKLVWDVGHQAYTHKILTGRKDGFDTLRQYEGMSGFPKIKESNCDAFDVGHSSTSISAALGLAKARDIKGEDNKIVAVIGDGALSGGMAYEALNNAARLDSNMIIVLNDNNMSITENVGGMANYLGKIRTGNEYRHLKDGVENVIRSVPYVGNRIADKVKRSKDSLKRLFIPGMLFEDMGLTYIGPIDGHNIEQMRRAFLSAMRVKEAVIVHVMTKKGKGYSFAEKKPAVYHGVEPFHIKTGENKKKEKTLTYTQVFGRKMIELADKYDDITAVCAAMPSGTGLMKYRQLYPKRYFDVGIAEEHAVTFAAGMAAGGLHPVVAIYSTFLQRAYDQILHDVCIEKLPVTFAIDRAGIVGSDGETHQGVFDLSYLCTMPNMTVLAPKDGWELEAMLEYSVRQPMPIAVRYPRGKVSEELKEFQTPIEYGKSEILFKESDIVLLAVGSMVETACAVREQLKNNGKNVSVVNVRFVKPIDTECLKELTKQHSLFVTLEENVVRGGFGEQVDAYLQKIGKNQIKVINCSVKDEFVQHGNVDLLKRLLGLDADSITERILAQL